MLHSHDVIRRRLLHDDSEKSFFSYKDLLKSEWSEKFERLMRNRLVIGAIRYGLIGDGNKKVFDRINYIRVKLKRYEETGNQEALVDIANLCLLEFEEGEHPLKHFKAMDDTNEHCKIKNANV